ncbi:MAG: transporter substrate-binding domain-containing protein [Pseudomonas sp.]|uniref:substrate-binding periplasmic protein n=1 Tax=Pseudomonas sp. TaxID=306 RepID=UPI0027333163|nr:transporter substrate-binding domain-containing protein [Pseudomonas sp.]MDP3847476.1 transporter substrate-binding domain-containing protein [Pseudomonas sp.]
MRIAILVLCALLSLPARASTLLVALEEANNAPFEFVDSNGQLTGFHVELIRAVSSRLGWTLEFERYPWKRAILALELGEVQAVSFVAKNPEREAFALFLPGNPLHVSRNTLYIKRSRAGEIHYLPDLEQMARRWRLASPSGYYISEEVNAMIANGMPIAQPTVTQSHLFSMLIAERYDAIFGFPYSLSSASANIPNLDQQVQRLDGALISGASMYLAFSRAAPAQLAEDFAKAYQLFRQDPAYAALAQRFEVTELLPKPGEFK